MEGEEELCRSENNARGSVEGRGLAGYIWYLLPWDLPGMNFQNTINTRSRDHKAGIDGETSLS